MAAYHFCLLLILRRLDNPKGQFCCAGTFFWFLFFMFTALQYCTMYGLFAVALTPDLMTAAVLSSAFYGVWNLTAGFIMPQPVSL